MPAPLPILVAEDEETDALILRLALKKACIPNPLVVARDGQEAVDYLAGAPPFSDRARHPLPGLLLLDLKMPRMNGFEVLTWLSNHPEFRNLPAVVLSSSSYEQDIFRARELGACDYFVKPHGFTELVHILEQVADDWLGLGIGTPVH